MQKFVDYVPCTSEQQRDKAKVRLPKNEKDFTSIRIVLEARSPFCLTPSKPVNLVSARVGDSRCKAERVSETVLKEMDL